VARDTRASRPLAAALQGALALGNLLNWGTRLGAAPGFRLKNLPKLQASLGLKFNRYTTSSTVSCTGGLAAAAPATHRQGRKLRSSSAGSWQPQRRAVHLSFSTSPPSGFHPSLQDTRSLDGRTNALGFLAKLLATAQPPVPPLADALPSLLAPGLKTSLAVRFAVFVIRTPLQGQCTCSGRCRGACGTMLAEVESVSWCADCR
jgi:hypothetical protein